ncbi:MAG: ABC transporter ATP-binding protein [Candidatus Tectomicrobia bacterium]|nr:ABC transporter ATP-binding protein [Candidatus Tectomicrobia bacterium]
MESALATPVSTSNAILCLHDAYMVREKGGNRFELHVPSFVIQPGEFVALVGASGCGKSTLLDILALVLRPTHAEAFTLCASPEDAPYPIMALTEEELARLRKSKIGYVLQTGGLLPFLTVKENIMLPCRINGLTDMEDRVNTLAERLAIGEQLSKKPQFLSGGQRQRAAIARALVHSPPLVLADEPTAAVDKPTAIDIRDAFKELTQRMGVTLCMVTHDESLVAGAADRTFGFEVTRESRVCTRATCWEKGLAGVYDSI